MRKSRSKSLIEKVAGWRSKSASIDSRALDSRESLKKRTKVRDEGLEREDEVRELSAASDVIKNNYILNNVRKWRRQTLPGR